MWDVYFSYTIVKSDGTTGKGFSGVHIFPISLSTRRVPVCGSGTDDLCHFVSATSRPRGFKLQGLNVFNPGTNGEVRCLLKTGHAPSAFLRHLLRKLCLHFSPHLALDSISAHRAPCRRNTRLTRFSLGFILCMVHFMSDIYPLQF